MGNKSKKSRAGRSRSSRQPDVHKKPLWFALGFAVLGGLLSLYATNLSYTIASSGITDASGCSVNDWINCDIAHASSYAHLFGVPVAVWGGLFYAFAAIAALLGLFSQNPANAAAFLSTAFILSIGAVLFSFYKAYNLIQLGVLCPVCVGMYISNIGLLFTLPAGLGVRVSGWGGFISNYVAAMRGADSDLEFSPRKASVFLVLAVIFGIGYAGAKNLERRVSGGADFDLDRAVSAHFRQTPIDVKTDSTQALWGNPDAKLTIVEFADFQCPACKQSAAHLRPTLFEFRKNLQFIFVNYPLDSSLNEEMKTQLHALAGDAARAGVCAQEFGDFWEYHDEIFRNQVSLGMPLYKRLAEKRGWDTNAFQQCIARPEITARIKSDIALGNAARITATPTVLINGRKLRYWANADFIRAVIRRELDAQR